MLGIDASLTSTGYAYQAHGKIITGHILSDPLRDSHRLMYVQKMLMQQVDACQPTLVALEGYAMGFGGGKRGGSPGRVFDIGELGGVIKLELWRRGIDVLIVPPSSMKGVIAGNGSAKKEQVQRGLSAFYGILGPFQEDEADAVGLMVFGEIRLGIRKIGVESKRLGSVEACKIITGRLKLTSER